MAKQDIKDRLDWLGTVLVNGFQVIALFVIGATIVWSAAHDYMRMIQAGRAGLDDILLLFIYLELGTIVGSTSRPTVCQCSSCSTSRSPR